MKIHREQCEPYFRKLDIGRLNAKLAADKSVAPNLRDAVTKAGYVYGLFHGGYKCPIKDGVLRHCWLHGCNAGIEARKQLNAAPAAGG